MKNFKLLLLSVLLVGLNSCSSNDDTEEEGIIVESGNFQKRVLIEDYTGTWCGWCPRVSFGIEIVEGATDNAVVVAIHREDEYNFNAGVLEDQIGLEGYPTAMLDRATLWDFPEPNNIVQVVDLTTTNARLGLAMKSTVTGGNINLEVKTKFGDDFTGAKLVVYVLENGLVSDQENYTTYYDGVDVLQNFTHNHVLRAAATNLLGDDFSATESVEGSEVTKTFSIPVPANVTNAANLEFVAVVVGADKKAINARKAAPGDDQAFEIVE